MLNTIKYLKGVMNFNLGLSGRAEWLSASENFTIEWKTIDEKFISDNKEKIKDWIKKNAGNDWNNLYIWFMDIYNDKNWAKWWSELTKLANLLKLSSTDAGYNLDNFLQKINEFGIKRGNVISQTRKEEKQLKKEVSKNSVPVVEAKPAYVSAEAKKQTPESSLNSVILNFNQRTDIRNKAKVRELQKALGWLKVDGIWWPRTEAALRNAIKGDVHQSDYVNNRHFKDNRKNEVANRQYEGDRSVFNWEVSTYKDAMAQIEKTGNAMSDMERQLILTKLLNWQIKWFNWKEKEGYHLKAAIQKIFWQDKYSEFAWKEKALNTLIRNNKTKFEDALAILTSANYNRDTNMTDGISQSRMETAGKFISKTWPWLAGIYLFDIPLPIMKEMHPGATVEKSQAFNHWLTEGMPGKFEDYLKNAPKSPNLAFEQNSLRWVLSTLKLSKNEQAKVLRWNLNGLSQKTQSMLLTYLESRLIPDLEVLRDQSFNSFEQGKWYTLGWLFGLFKDGKSKEVTNIIKWLKQAVASKNLNASPNVSKAFKLLAEEWDVSKDIIDKVEKGHDYMNTISRNDKEIQSQFGPLLDLGSKNFNEYNGIYRFTNIDSVANYGISKSDMNSLKKLMPILSQEPINRTALENWKKQNPNTYRFVTSLGNDSEMWKYLLTQIPKGKFEKVNVWNSKHWRNLSKYSNAEALRIAEKESPDGKISTLWSAYNSFVTKWGLRWVSYEDFRNAFANKTNVPVNSITTEKIVNTWRKDWQWELTRFANLAKSKGDTEVFKLAPINKNYSFYDAKLGKVDVNVNYNLYLRPDCDNPLLVPGTIKITKNGREIPQAEIISLIQTSGRLPVFIPWNFISEWLKPGKNGEQVNVSWTSRPGTDISNASLEWTKAAAASTNKQQVYQATSSVIKKVGKAAK